MVLRHGTAAVADLVSLYIDFQFVQRYGKGESKMEANYMKVKGFPARIKNIGKRRARMVESALLKAPKAPIQKLHEEAVQFERLMLARRSAR